MKYAMHEFWIASICLALVLPVPAGAELHDLVAVDKEKKKLGEAGKQWNPGCIVNRNDTVEQWVDGDLVMTIKFDSENWMKRFKKSKYRDVERFAASGGPILLQD